MQYCKQGEPGLVVSRMEFGATTFGSAESAVGPVHKVDPSLADELVATAFDDGINLQRG